LQKWTTFTPDGRRLTVRREHDLWSVVCGDGDEAQGQLLDVALIQAVRGQPDIVGHSMKIDYATWTRALADRLSREAEANEKA
jgi:hypothetical protein